MSTSVFEDIAVAFGEMHCVRELRQPVQLWAKKASVGMLSILKISSIREWIEPDEILRRL
ncbi:hypothetical protein CHS0354_029124 [Potamilus streckersoni]|uniref:Uncharacterized protein n=1 Tax=Potamilus streckersoni TaxID=2493646 RepID=A0AAE0SY00_9BIVA|nr:hypothetical protein CHS0354_029124 [Potamilus streckersoni]